MLGKLSGSINGNSDILPCAQQMSNTNLSGKERKWYVEGLVVRSALVNNKEGVVGGRRNE